MTASPPPPVPPLVKALRDVREMPNDLGQALAGKAIFVPVKPMRIAGPSPLEEGLGLTPAAEVATVPIAYRWLVRL